MERRTFVGGVASGLLAGSLYATGESKSWRVAVIGHTGRGNYGHGLDTVWLRVPETKIVAIADADPSGRAAASRRLSVENSFGDYRKMLPATKPDIVAVCPRQPDQHHDMILAAIEAGARGLYVEKPFCRSPAEADAIVEACRKHGAKLAVAHRNRYHPTLAAIDHLLASGGIGKVLEIRGRGKGDRRGGAEDLWVLGCHVLNLIHYFGGDPQSCSALMRQNGRPVTRLDVTEGNEALGPLAGNEVHARYEMRQGTVAYFDSIANDGTQNAGFGLQIIGSEGLIGINCDREPLAYLVAGNPFEPTGGQRDWIPISSAGAGLAEPQANLQERIGQHLAPVRDLIQSVRDDRQPVCNVQEGRMTVEMISAVFASHYEGGRAVPIPLAERGNALVKLRSDV